MNTIEKYIDAAMNRDFDGVAQLFTKYGHYNDFTPNGASQQEFHVYGREAISMFFRNKFFFHKYSLSEPRILNDHQVEFVATIGDYYLVALADLEYAEDGQIHRMTVRPR